MSASILRSCHFGTISRAQLPFKERSYDRKTNPFWSGDPSSFPYLCHNVMLEDDAQKSGFQTTLLIFYENWQNIVHKNDTKIYLR